MRRKHEERIQRLRQDAMDMAADDLKEAKAEEARLVQELYDARTELSNSTVQLAEVSANIEKAKNEFERLGKKDMELLCPPPYHVCEPLPNYC